MGQTTRCGARSCFHVRQMGGGAGQPGGRKESEFDGAVNETGLIWGTYVHGVFDLPDFRRAWINRIRSRKSLPPLADVVSQGISQSLGGQLDAWADHLQLHLNIKPLILAVSTRT